MEMIRTIRTKIIGTCTSDVLTLCSKEQTADPPAIPRVKTIHPFQERGKYSCIFLRKPFITPSAQAGT